MYAYWLTSKVIFDAAALLSSSRGKFWAIICYISSKNKIVIADNVCIKTFNTYNYDLVYSNLDFSKKSYSKNKKTVIEKKLGEILTNKWNCAPLALPAFILHNQFLEICIGLGGVSTPWNLLPPSSLLQKYLIWKRTTKV